MRKYFFLIAILILFLVLPTISAAHYVVGYVYNARDGQLSNGHTILIWNPVIGFSDNITDTIGPAGNSKTDSIYMLDCELLNNSCQIGSILSLKLINNGDNYISSIVNVTITGAGYDTAPNITINSPPNFSSIIVDDSFLSPLNEIDLIAASNRTVLCTAVVQEFDAETLNNINSTFYQNTSSFSSADDNNDHYTNSSCIVNVSYAPNQTQINCSYQVAYYANYGSWICTIKVSDNMTTSNSSDNTTMNRLLSIGVNSIVDYGPVDSGKVSSEAIINITNYGNVILNISLEGYARNPNDGFAMNCSLGSIRNISVGFEKYNLTNSNPGVLTLAQFESLYNNLTTVPTVKTFNIISKTDDVGSDIINQTYWRMYVPRGAAGNCSGNIIFGARTTAGN